LDDSIDRSAREESQRRAIVMKGTIMILGMTTYVFIHVVLSLIGIGAGLIVAFGMMISKRLSGWTALFLLTTVLTSITGFFLPADHIKPSHIVGVVSLIVLAVALYALYGRNLLGAWRPLYAATAVLALYLNVFVLIAQVFLKVQALKDLAPSGSEPPFLLAQGAALVVFIVVGLVSIIRFQPDAIMRVR
jgi:hypothetical protein